ncbi:tRNA-splicing endonuclease subunit Sen34 [Bacillus rossius redtenbacheri]|uniref:tRNA-splicing endonuclease subunit Sen34 n=1 Tax=Bacillus rossius redtenbacheri TaxID=93214 RepID=UPI002FDCFEF3
MGGSTVSDIINLTVHAGQVFVWNAEDWSTLRRQHRIVGQLVGSLARFPRQSKFAGLPLTLLPEEATLLVERGLACLQSVPALSRAPSDAVRKDLERHRKLMHKEQVELCVDERKRQVTEMIDRIMEGRRRKQAGQSSKKRRKSGAEDAEQSGSRGQPPTEQERAERSAMLEAELAKVQAVSEDSTMVQVFTACPWLREDDARPVEWSFPETPAEKLRYATFKALWEQGYYVSPGQKFGSDYLVYPGDPMKYHAHFMVLCQDRSSPLLPTEISVFGRLGTDVRKTAVMAYFAEDGETVRFQSVQWARLA